MTAAATSYIGSAMEEALSGCMSRPSGIPTGGNSCRSTISPGASVQLSHVVSEEEDADDIPLPELAGRDAREMRWLGKTPIVLQR